MNCEEAQRRWHTRYDDVSDDPGLQAHIAACAACRVYAQQMEQVVGILDAMRVETEPVVSRNSAERVDHGEPARVRRRHFPIRWATGIAATMALLVGASLLLLTQHRPELKPVLKHQPVFGMALEGESSMRYMVVAQTTTDPDVQMYWLYPTLTEPQP
jgi:predicted anti-sigma-YlaC factor YlaD